MGKNLEFVKKISQLKLNWEGQTAFSIKEAFQTLNINNNLLSSMKKEIFSSPFTIKDNNDVKIDRIRLQQYWNSDCTPGSKVLLTLLWGGLHNTWNFKGVFIRNLDENIQKIYEFDNEFFKKDFENLFKDFEGTKKITGVDYAFFSKIFQFSNPDSPYIICDQWTMKAVATYLITKQQKEKLNHIFTLIINHSNQINIGLRKKNGSVLQSYLCFINVFNKMTTELTQVLPQFNNNVRKTEEILFGWDRRIKSEFFNNPRYYYQNILHEYLKNETVNKEKSIKIIKPNNLNIQKIFIHKNKSYYALRLSPDKNSKIGYFDDNYWLCIQEKFAKLFKGIKWEEGNSKGGSESKKIQFNSITDLMKEFELNNLTFVKVNW